MPPPPPQTLVVPLAIIRVVVPQQHPRQPHRHLAVAGKYQLSPPFDVRRTVCAASSRIPACGVLWAAAGRPTVCAWRPLAFRRRACNANETAPCVQVLCRVLSANGLVSGRL